MLDLPDHVVILLVDDSENDIEIIRHAIERAGLTNRLSLPTSGDEGDSDGRDQAFVATGAIIMKANANRGHRCISFLNAAHILSLPRPISKLIIFVGAAA